MPGAVSVKVGLLPGFRRALTEGPLYQKGSGVLPEKDNLSGHKGQSAVHRGQTMWPFTKRNPAEAGPVDPHHKEFLSDGRGVSSFR